MKGKRIFSIMLSILMVVALLPSVSIPARAAGANYTLIVLENDNTVYKYEDGDSQGAASETGISWNGTTKVLTLSGLNFTTSSVHGLEVPSGTTIKATSNSTIATTYSSDDQGTSCGISAWGNVTIDVDENVTLTATGGNNASDSDSNSSYGVLAFGDLEKKGLGTLDARGGGANYSYGIGCTPYSQGAFTMTDGTLTATGYSVNKSESMSCGVDAPTNFTMNGGTITATGSGFTDNSCYSVGITCGNFSMAGGTIIAKTTSGSNPNKYAMSVTGTIPAAGSMIIKSHDGTDYTDAASFDVSSDFPIKILKLGLDANGATVTDAQITTVPAPDYALYVEMDNDKILVNNYKGAEVTGLTGITWDGTQGILTLNNFNFTTTSAIGLIVPGDTIIKVIGDSTIINTNTNINQPNNDRESGICIAVKGSLYIDVEENKTLTVIGGNPNVAEGIAAGVVAGDFVKMGKGTLNVTGGDVNNPNIGGTCGVYSISSFTMNAGTINAVATACAEGKESCGIFSKKYDMVGGTLFAKGNTKALNAEPNTSTSGVTYTYSTDAGSTWAAEKSSYSGTQFAIKATNTPPPGPTGDSGPSGNSGSTPTSTLVPAIIDGKSVDIGTIDIKDGIATITVDQKTLETQIGAAHDSIVIPVTPTTDTNTVTAQLVVKNVEDIAAKDMTLSVQVGNISYDLPAAAIDTKALMAKFGTDDPAKVPVSIEITTHVNAETQTQVDKATKKLGADIVIPAVEFHITATYEGKAVEVDTFDSYVGRTMEITPEQAKKITTAIVVNSNGTTRHVPTNVYEKDGKWYAEINSRTNSTYVLVYKDSKFTDISGKWYSSFAKEVSERKIMVGFSKNSIFKGDSSISRAGLMQVLVRSLGLPETGNARVFKKINQKASYAGALGTAYEYGIITKAEAATFNPAAKITRQDAMVYIQRAARILNYTGKNGKLSKYTDGIKVAANNKAAVKFAIGSGLDTGADGKWRPDAKLTRGETAAIAIKLLQKAKVIDVRTEE